jgi:hypothetical protein
VGHETVDDRGVVRRVPSFEDLGRTGGGYARGAEVVLQGNRHAREQTRVFPASYLLVNASSRGAGTIFVDVQKDVEFFVASTNRC